MNRFGIQPTIVSVPNRKTIKLTKERGDVPWFFVRMTIPTHGVPFSNQTIALLCPMWTKRNAYEDRVTR